MSEQQGVSPQKGRTVRPHLFSIVRARPTALTPLTVSSATLIDELTRHLALTLRAVAAELLGELRAQHAAGRAWSEAEARDQCEVVPSVLRLLHRTLSDYHAAFADKVSPALTRTRPRTLTR